LGHFSNVPSLKFDNIKHQEKFPSVFGGQAILVRLSLLEKEEEYYNRKGVDCSEVLV
jgi:hypothetical protein